MFRNQAMLDIEVTSPFDELNDAIFERFESFRKAQQGEVSSRSCRNCPHALSRSLTFRLINWLSCLAARRVEATGNSDSQSANRSRAAPLSARAPSSQTMISPGTMTMTA